MFSRALTSLSSHRFAPATSHATRPMQPNTQKERPRYKHDRSQSNLNHNFTPDNHPRNPSKIQANVLFVFSRGHAHIGVNSLTLRGFRANCRHSTLHVSFFRPYSDSRRIDTVSRHQAVALFGDSLHTVFSSSHGRMQRGKRCGRRNTEICK